MCRYFIALLLISLLYLFAMSGGGNESPKQSQEIKEDSQAVNIKQPDQNGLKSTQEKKIEKFILKNVWPDQEKSAQMTEEDYNQIRNDYFEKARKKGETNKQVINEFWNHRINVNALEELKKLGADPGTKDAEKLSLYDKAMFSQVVVIGTVLDVTNDKRKKAFCPYSHRVKIEEILTGEGLIDDFDEIIVEMDYIMEPLLVNEKYCLFLTRFTLEDMARYNDACRKEPDPAWLYEIQPLPENVNEPNVFTPILYSWFPVKYLKTEHKEIIKKIGKLNDKANFYNRSYK